MCWKFLGIMVLRKLYAGNMGRMEVTNVDIDPSQSFDLSSKFDHDSFDHSHSGIVDFGSVQYFAESSSLNDVQSNVFLESPTARSNTAHSKFGQFPCSGGIKGSSTYYKPGSSAIVKWQVQNPVKGGK